jgi:hypothetical protein
VLAGLASAAATALNESRRLAGAIAMTGSSRGRKPRASQFVLTVSRHRRDM